MITKPVSLFKQSPVLFVMLFVFENFALFPAYAQDGIVQTSLSDYAYMAKLFESSSTVQQVRLPREILISATREELLDIAVFDRHFKRLPSGISYVSAPPDDDSERQSAPAPRFRVEASPVFYKGADYYEFKRPSEVKPSSLRFYAEKIPPLGKGEIHAGNDGIGSKQLLNSQIRYRDLESAEGHGGFSPSKNWPRYWFLPKNNAGKVYVDLIYSNLVVTFIGNGNSPYTLAWGNYQEPMKIDGLTIWDIDLGEAYPPAVMVKQGAIEESGGKLRLGGLAEGITH